MDSQKLREQGLMYLYEEMSAEKEKAFLEELDKNPLIRRLIEEEQKLEDAYPKGRSAEVPDDLREIPEHHIIVVGLGVQKALALVDTQTRFDLGHEVVVDHLGQLADGLGAVPQDG